MAKLQKLKTELSEARDDFNETQYDRYLSDSESMLDKLFDEYKELIQAEMKNRDALLQKGIDAVRLSADSIMSTIQEYETKNNYHDILGNISRGIVTMNGDYSALSKIQSDIMNSISPAGTIPTAIGSIKLSVENGLNNIASLIKQILNSNYTGTSSNEDKQQGSSEESSKKNTLLSLTPPPATPLVSKADKSETKKAVEAVFANSKYYDKGKNKKASDYKTKINQVLFEKNGKVLSNDGLAQLRKIFNTTNDGIYQAMLDLSKAVGNIKNVGGFKKGGIAKLIKSKGEDGITFARNGEGFIAPEHVQPIEELVDSVPQLNNAIKTAEGLELIPVQPDWIKNISTEALKNVTPDLSSMIKPNLPNLQPVSNTNNNDININLGGITMHGVNDPNKFAKQLVDSIQNNQKVKATIRANSTNLLTNDSRLDTNKIRR